MVHSRDKLHGGFVGPVALALSLSKATPCTTLPRDTVIQTTMLTDWSGRVFKKKHLSGVSGLKKKIKIMCAHDI